MWIFLRELETTKLVLKLVRNYLLLLIFTVIYTVVICAKCAILQNINSNVSFKCLFIYYKKR